VRQCAAVRAAVRGSALGSVWHGGARGSVRLSDSAVVCGSASGSAWQFAAMCGSKHGSMRAMRAEYVRQCPAVRLVVCGSVGVRQWECGSSGWQLRCVNQ
jgi:hypothetical protein